MYIIFYIIIIIILIVTGHFLDVLNYYITVPLRYFIFSRSQILDNLYSVASLLLIFMCDVSQFVFCNFNVLTVGLNIFPTTTWDKATTKGLENYWKTERLCHSKNNNSCSMNIDKLVTLKTPNKKIWDY